MTREEAIKVAYGISVTKAQHEALQFLIPELRESEDERIRKHIIEILDRLAPCHWDGNEKSECIAYLEKQKEQKPEWSEEDEKMVETICKEGDLKPSEQRWLKSLKNRGNSPQSNTNSPSWSEEDEKKIIIKHLVLLGYPIDANGNIPDYNQTFEFCKSALVYWLKQDLQKMLANKRIEPDGIKTETLLKDSYIQAYREGIEDSIRKLSSQCEKSSPQPHWKPSEEDINAIGRGN